MSNLSKKFLLVLLVLVFGAFNIFFGCIANCSEVESLNTTRHSPWFLNWHMQTQTQAADRIYAGEGGQVVMSMEVSPFDKSLMLFGTDTTGLWRSTDGGANWSPVNNGINMQSIPDIEFDPNNADTVYMVQSVAGTTDNSVNYINRNHLDGVYKSIDGGLSWTQVLDANIVCSSNSNRLMAFDASGALYVLTNSGVQKTVNGGKDWHNLGLMGIDKLQKTSGMFDLYVSPDGNTIITACGNTGIGITFNGTEENVVWVAKNGLEENQFVTAYAIAVHPTTNEWYASFDNYLTSRTCGLYKSNDNGTNWILVKNYFKKDSAEVMSSTPITRIYFNKLINDSVVIYVFSESVSSSLRYSTDNGRTWVIPVYPSGGEVANPKMFLNMQPYCAYPLCFVDENTVFLPTTNGIGKSTDAGKTFVYSSSGFSGAVARNFKFVDDKILLAFMDKGLGITDSPLTEGEYPTARIIETNRYSGAKTVGDVGVNPNNTQHMIIGLGTWSNHILSETKNGGVNWNQIAGTESETSCNFIEFHKSDSNTVYTTHFTSRDCGVTWVRNCYGNANISIGDMSAIDSDIVVGYSGSNIYFSDDKGVTWLYTAVPGTPIDVKCDLFYTNIIWVTTLSGSIIKIVKNDNVFTYSIGLEGVGRLYSIAQNPNDAMHLLAGGAPATARQGPGLFETLDGGKTWHVVDGLPGTKLIYKVAFLPNMNKAILGTYNGTFIYEYENYKKYLRGLASVGNISAATLRSNNQVAVTGEIDPSFAGDKVTMLLKSIDADENNLKSGDIGYIAETTINSDGRYIFRFNFSGFTFNSEGVVNNYRVLVNQAGICTEANIKAVDKVYDLTKISLKTSLMESSIEVNANIINLFKLDSLAYAMCLALYDINNSLVGVKLIENNIDIDATTASIQHHLPDKAVIAKAIVWDNMQNIIPLCEMQKTNLLIK